MLEDISEYQAIEHAFSESRTPLFARKRLLAMLLARRRALRVICGPAHFGKSVLAYQYAHEVFADGTVFWIDASEPAFLISLDEAQAKGSQAKVDLHVKKEGASRLIIIDDCPTLDTDRFSILCSVIGAALDAGDEVILTTKDTRWTKIKKPYPEVIDKAMRAMQEAGVTPVVRPIRGGTDGARLSYMGLPCPNLFTGGMNFHGKFEYCSLNTMQKAVQTILNLVQLWKTPQ